MNRKQFVSGLVGLFAVKAHAQFAGPGAPAPAASVGQLREARLGRYFTVEGRIVAHQRQNYYTFRDGSGEIRVEIDPALWQKRKVGPDDKVRLVGELDQGSPGRDLWTKSLEILN
ncbi:MAG: NirD/YgiW/YdeI family stress tolerance protein [Burkholderiaceae bacterium]|jgi:uncharacterized protein (TIGR00156 family)|nr:NirD/YgiW/YdeI family stress tolerance protein [Burkholderiaceae bacterium]